MKCPQCGTENKPDAVFCMSCGASLPDVPFSQLEKKEDRRLREGVAQPGGPQAVTVSGEETASPLAPAGQEPAAATPAQPPTTGEDKAAPAAATAPLPQADKTGAAPTPAGAPTQQQREPIPARPAPEPAAPAAPAAAGARSVVEEVGGKPETPPAAPAQAPPTPAAPPPQAPAAPAQAAAAETRMAPPIPAPREEKQATPPPPAPAPLITPPAAAPTSGEEYYIPPEVDYHIAAPSAKPAQAEPEPVLSEQVSPAPPPSLDSTQEVAAIIAAGAAAGTARERKSVCPECYAPNPEGNSYCQECGSALPLTTGRQPEAARAATGKPSAGQTAVLPSAPSHEGVAAQPVYAGQLPKARKAYGEKAFGVADVLALFAAGAAAVAIALSYALDSFAWKKGVDIAMFSHQGAYTQGRTDLLGGPGLLPYSGAEFFTVGMVVAIGLALALIFLAVRVGRGPMYILSGCILLVPVAYLLFQAILPLRQMGIEVDASVGLSGMFFGDAAFPGMGPPVWLITGAGLLLVIAGFMAPPRGWGRLFTFLLCFSVAVGIAFFCAACFNWNLFISEPAALTAQPLADSLVFSWVLLV